MKNLVIVLAAICAYQSTTFAQEAKQEVACAEQIKARVERLATHNGYSNCNIGEPQLDPGISLRIEKGTVDVSCMHHVSAMSVTRVLVDYRFGVPALRMQGPDCSQVTVTEMSTLPPDEAGEGQLPPEQVRPVISGSNRNLQSSGPQE